MLTLPPRFCTFNDDFIASKHAVDMVGVSLLAMATISRWGSGRREVVGFAAKVIGIGLFAGLMLTYCNVLIDACFRGLR